MEIRKFSGIDFENPEAVDAAFAQVESRPIACCFWMHSPKVIRAPAQPFTSDSIPMPTRV